VNSDIGYLQLLEDDLREAAQFEKELDDEARERTTRGHTQTAPRRLPRRGRWTSAAAAVVAFLVVAGGIGLLAQTSSQPDRSTAGAVSGTTAPLADLRQGLPNIGSGSDTGFSFLTNGTNPSTNQSKGTGSGLTAAVPQGDLSKIVRNGQIGIQMDNGQFTNGVDQVTKIAVDNKGMVLSSTSENDRSGTFTLRIPVARFDRVMGALRAIAPAGGVLYQDASGKDVTANFIDFQARLGILKKQRDLLIGLQSKVTDAGQILFYADKINAVQLNIETIQGNLNFLNDSVAQSTIKVELREKDAPQGTAPDNVSNPSLRTAWHHGEQGFLRVLGAVVIGLGYLIPLSIILLLVWGGVMLARRRRPAAS
jgi:hypothetical protein